MGEGDGEGWRGRDEGGFGRRGEVELDVDV